MSDRFTLLPYARPALLAAALAPIGTGQRLRAPFAAQVLADGAASGAAIALASEIRGPGDVVGFDEAAISATDPDVRTAQFETNYFPYVEFSEPDFPWRYTLDASDSGGRLQPWLLLIALKADEFEVLPQGDGPLPAIRVLDTARSLPPVADGRFVAHVHLPGEPSGAAITSALSAAGARARMLCHRRLQEATAYTLFLVPAYDQGRTAGLGGTPAAAPHDAPAWTVQSGPVDLPVYFSRRFVTNSGEDVEELLRRLRALRADEVAALAPPERVDAATPGHYQGYRKDGVAFVRRAATNPPGAVDTAFSTEPELVALMARTLTEAISGETADETRGADGAAVAAANDPLVTFPAYGWRFRAERQLDAARPGRYWFDRLNLDLPMRDAAERGAGVVRQHQEAYMRLAWAQYEEIVAANRQLAALQAAEELAKRLAQDRFDRLAPGVALSLAEPLLDVVPGTDGMASVAGELRGHGAPGAFTSRAMRRLAAKRQRPAAGPGVAGDKNRISPAPAIPGDLDAIGFGAGAKPLDRSLEGLVQRAVQLTPPTAALRRALTELMATDILELPVPRSGAVRVESFSGVALVKPVGALLRAMPRAKADTLTSGRSAREERRLAPVYRAPIIPDPLADRLRDADPRAILPGLSNLPDNTVSFHEEDRAFIEAVMVGANHEMNAELRWRGFPTDMRGTVFRRFWQRGYTPADPRGDDIGPIHDWRGALGANPPDHDHDQAENLVIVIKGDLVRKIGLPILEVNIASGTSFLRGQGVTHQPTFMGRIGDAAYFGFDLARDALLAPTLRDRVFMVICEPPGRLRFGLDIATQAARVGRRNYGAVRLRFPVMAMDSSRGYARQPHPPTAPAPAVPAFGTWDDFSWGHVRTGGSGYVDFSPAPRPAAGPDLWGAAKTSATVARSLWQRPIAAILPLKRVLL